MEYFQPRQRTTHSNLPFVSRPVNRETFLAFAAGRDGFEALIHSDVKQAISKEAEKALPNETIGLLAGRVLRDEHGPYALVLAAKGAGVGEIDATPSHVRLSANGHAQVRSRLEESAYGLDVIGWYHSHPRFPARFSPVDVTEQSTWRDPNHIGIVISGVDHATPFGVYRGPEALLLSPIPASPPPPPPPSPVVHIIPAHDTNDEADRSAPHAVLNPGLFRVVQVLIRGKTVTRFLPLALAVVALTALFNIIQLNRRIEKLEAAGKNLRPDDHPAPITTTTVTPTPVPSSSPAMTNLLDGIHSAPRPDLVDRQGTKVPILTRSRRRTIGSNSNKRSTASDRKSETRSLRSPEKVSKP